MRDTACRGPPGDRLRLPPVGGTIETPVAVSGICRSESGKTVEIG